MKLKMPSTQIIACIVCACASMAVAGEPAVPPAPAIPVVSAPAQPATSGAVAEKALKPEAIIVRINAPIFSPQFAKTPLASVNEELITVEDLKKTLGTIHEGMSEGKAAPKRNFPELLKRLINSQLIIQEARSMELNKLEEVETSVSEYSKNLLRETLLSGQIKDVKADEKEVDKAYRERTREWRIKSLILKSLDDAKALEAGLKAGKNYDELYDQAIKDGRGGEGGKSDVFIARDVVNPTMLTALEKMKPGEISKMLPLEKGYLFYRMEEVRSREDQEAKERVRQEMDGSARLKALESYQAGLIKKNVVMKKLFDKLDFENKKVKFEKHLKDKRVVADIKGEKPVTVADLAEAVAAKFYHGVERAIEGKKVNKAKKEIMNELLALRLFEKDAKDRKIAEQDEFRAKVLKYTNSLLFGTFITKVVRPEITVTSGELKAFYDLHAKEYTSQETYQLEAIAFSSAKNAEIGADKLRKGMELKWFKANADGVVSIDKKYFNLFTGESLPKTDLPENLQKSLTGVVSGDYRLFVDGDLTYIVAVLEYEPPRTKTYPEVESFVQEKVFYEKLNKGVDAWADKLRTSSEVIMYADFAQ